MNAFRNDEAGATLAEYAVLIGFIAFVSVAAIKAIGIQLKDPFVQTAGEIKRAK